MNDQRDAAAIIVGAGILGTATAYHLQRAGFGPVTLLDAGEPGRGTSGAGAGFVGYWAAGYLPGATADEFALEEYGVGFYRSLSESGYSIDYRADGSLFVATSEDGVQHIAKIAAHELAPPGCRELNPLETHDISGGLLAAETVTGAVLHPGGIQISAGLATRQLVAAVTSAGVDVRPHTPVLEVLVDDQGVAGVATPDGVIRSRNLVLACGAWTNQLLRPLGVALPIAPLIASRVVSPPSGVSTSTPTVMVPEWQGLWLREHRGGLTWGNMAGYAPLHEYPDQIKVGAHPQIEGLIGSMLADLGPRLDRLVPSHDTSCLAWTQGLPCFTPDGRFIAGAVPSIPGLHVAAGDNEAGVTHGPGIGRMIADLILGNTPDSVDPASFRTDRFPRPELTDAEIFAATPEFG